MTALLLNDLFSLDFGRKAAEIYAQQVYAALMVLRRGYTAPQHHQYFFVGERKFSRTLTVYGVVAGNKSCQNPTKSAVWGAALATLQPHWDA